MPAAPAEEVAMTRRRFFQLMLAGAGALVGLPPQSVRAADVTDLHPMFRGKQFREGLNLIHTSPNGIRIYANVQGGRLADYQATDAQGRRLPVRLEQGGPGPGSSIAKKADKKAGSSEPETRVVVTCRICVDVETTVTTPDGKKATSKTTQCYSAPCTGGMIHGTIQ
jgi:hypothetical protein